MEKNARKYISFIFIFIVKITKNLFQMNDGACRYIPTCSQYAKDALEKYTIIKALLKITIRVIKCNPFSKGGFDPA